MINKTKLLIVGLLICLTNSVYAQIELKVVYEKTFPDSIIDVVMDTVTVTTEEAVAMGWKKESLSSYEKTKGRVTILYPKLTVTGSGRLGWYMPDNLGKMKNIKIYDLKSKAAKTIPALASNGKGKVGREYYKKSSNGEYFLMTRYPDENNQGWIGGSLYNKNGDKLWTITDIGMTPVNVSVNGVVSFVRSSYGDEGPGEPGGDVVLYDSKGKMISIIKNPEPKVLISRFHKLSADGKYILRSLSDCKKARTVFTLSTIKGEQMWSIDFPNATYTGYQEESEIIPGVGVLLIYTIDEHISPSGKLEVYACLIDWNGNIKWKRQLEVKGNMLVNISNDQKICYIITGIGYIWALTIDNGNLIWSHKETWAPKTPYDIDTATELHFREMLSISNNIIIKGAPTENWNKSSVFVFNKEQGLLIYHKEYMNKQIMIKNVDDKVMLIDGKKISIVEFIR